MAGHRHLGAVGLVFGIGTGRCGTMSLTRLLNAQKYVKAVHEDKPLLAWEPDRAAESPIDRIVRQAAMRPVGTRIIAEVAFFLLPHLPVILRHYPYARVICLKRDRQEVIESFVRKVQGNWGTRVNHWTTRQEGLIQSPYCPCFPKYDVADIASGVSRYWDEYDDKVGRLMRQHPSQVRVWPTESLGDRSAVRSMLDFAGVCRSCQRIIHPHVNRNATA